ncbi:MAG TPA: ElyC/SanA/YdcF family protein [Mycobacteriales bacterium]|nr:ElyC/SanA/YdcF family protein [Mycobacteriales bacterium]
MTVTDAPTGPHAALGNDPTHLIVERSVEPPVEAAPRPGFWRRWRRPRRLLALGTGFVAFVLFGPWALISLATEGDRYDVASVPAAPVAIVFGAGLDAPDKPSGFLAHRLDVAVQLYRAHKVQHILVTGDNGTVFHNEVQAMEDYLGRHGVPASAVTQDHAGFDTYDSCYRAKAIFSVTSAIVVTTDYHLSRALWTCQRVGVHAVGVSVPEWSRTNHSMYAKFVARELLADSKALWQTLVTHPDPRFLGPKVPLN